MPTGAAGLTSQGQAHMLVLMGGFLAAGLAALAAILALTGLRLSGDFLPYPLIAAGLVGLAGFSRWRGHPWQLGDTALLGGLVILGLLLCGLVANTGLRLGFPVADPLLARSDARLGLDVKEMSHLIANAPAIAAVMYWVYAASGIMCLAAVMWNLVHDHRKAAWQTVATIIVAMQLTALVSLFVPARGATAFFGLAELQGRGLPPGAGTYFLNAFEHFRTGTDLLVRMEDMHGVVSFPSFHTVMALVFLQGFARSRWLWPVFSLCVLTIVSTIPMGGHYVTDLLGGMVVWLCSALLAARACQTGGLRIGSWPGWRRSVVPA